MKRNKMTPEEQKALEADRAARAAARKAEAEAAAAKRRQDAEVWHQKLADTARALKALTGDGIADWVAYSVGSAWLSADAELNEWLSDFRSSPWRSFEWTSSPMKAAAKREILDAILRDVMEGHTLADAVRESAKETTRRFMCNYDAPTSTSPGHNAMMIEKRDAQSGFVRPDGGTFAEWLRDLDKAAAEAAHKDMVADPV